MLASLLAAIFAMLAALPAGPAVAPPATGGASVVAPQPAPVQHAHQVPPRPVAPHTATVPAPAAVDDADHPRTRFACPDGVHVGVRVWLDGRWIERGCPTVGGSN